MHCQRKSGFKMKWFQTNLIKISKTFWYFTFHVLHISIHVVFVWSFLQNNKNLSTIRTLPYKYIFNSTYKMLIMEQVTDLIGSTLWWKAWQAWEEGGGRWRYKVGVGPGRGGGGTWRWVAGWLVCVGYYSLSHSSHNEINAVHTLTSKLPLLKQKGSIECC